MRILDDRHLHDIERIVGRPLGPDDLAEVGAIDQLDEAAIDVALAIQAESKPLAVMYLNERVPGASVGTLLSFLDGAAECRART